MITTLQQYRAKAILTSTVTTPTSQTVTNTVASSTVVTNLGTGQQQTITTTTQSVANVTTNLVYTNSWVDLSFWTGARFGSPYTINGTTKTLTSSGNTSQGYLEINLNSRYVLRHGRDADIYEADTNLIRKFYFPWHPPGCGFSFPMPDITASLGYVFSQSSGPSNYNASTIIGSSDFYLNASLGVPLLRYCTDTNGAFKGQLTLEISDGFVTDKQFMELHHNFFVGLGLQGGFLFKGNQAYWFGRAGYAEIDQPVLVGGTSTVQFNGLGQPDFNQDWIPSTGATVVFPLTPAINLNAGIDAYYTRHPANWEANLGVSFDLSKLVSALQ
jgi:hypothetical protein